MSYLTNLKLKTRWDTIPQTSDGFKLLCSNPECSLSSANVKGGKLSTTSMHGNERHSQQLTKMDMAFMTLLFLNSLSEKDLNTFLILFNKSNENFILNLEKVNNF
jgi:hypothetical protein